MVGVRRWVTQRPLFRPYNRRNGGLTASAGREADERASSDPLRHTPFTFTQLLWEVKT